MARTDLQVRTDEERVQIVRAMAWTLSRMTNRAITITIHNLTDEGADYVEFTDAPDSSQDDSGSTAPPAQDDPTPAGRSPMPETVWLYTGPNPRLVKVLAWHSDSVTVVDYDLDTRLRLTDARPRLVYRSDLAVPHIGDFTGTNQ